MLLEKLFVLGNVGVWSVDLIGKEVLLMFVVIVMLLVKFCFDIFNVDVRLLFCFRLIFLVFISVNFIDVLIV